MWAEANEAIVVNASAGLASRARTLTTVSRVFRAPVNLVEASRQGVASASMVKKCAGVHPGGRVPSNHESNVDVATGGGVLSFSLCPHPQCISSTIALIWSRIAGILVKKPAICFWQSVDPIWTCLAAVCLIGGVLLAFVLPSVFFSY
ncbi:MAG: hypothetical protein U0319_07675 [Nitrospira sp.]